mmetsp:Transcript_20094/g.42898  ORF Transcript_20094/g.42898 Transcript_20094/m.42898 type:complete len:340 (-) Transcript_20094:1-1020(-)
MVVFEELPDDGDEPVNATVSQQRSSDAKASPQVVGKSSEHMMPEEIGVFCSIYDITPRLNSILRCCCCPGWGIFHSGVEVHGREFAFGGHGDSTTGVWAGKPQAIEGATFREKVLIGKTGLDAYQLRQAVAAIASQWSGESYDTLTRNCNHFTTHLCLELTGKPPPRRINRCAESVIVRCLFKSCIRPLARCLERCFYKPSFVTYQNDESESPGESDDFCIKGARGMNQVLVEVATHQKNSANEVFRKGHHEQAAGIYMEALGLIQAMSRFEEDDANDCEVLKQANEVSKALLLNIAACNLKVQDWERTVLCCNRVLEWDPENPKALFRRGMAPSPPPG